MKKALYNIMVVISAVFLVNAGMDESETLKIIPDYQPKPDA
ncbi:MAG: hypothetical protein ACOYJB_06525 [Christensenellaceae bacterium]